MRLASCLGGAILSSSSTIIHHTAHCFPRPPRRWVALPLPALTRLVCQGMWDVGCGGNPRPCVLLAVSRRGDSRVDVEQPSHLRAAELIVVLHAAALTCCRAEPRCGNPRWPDWSSSSQRLAAASAHATCAVMQWHCLGSV